MHDFALGANPCTKSGNLQVPISELIGRGEFQLARARSEMKRTQVPLDHRSLPGALTISTSAGATGTSSSHHRPTTAPTRIVLPKPTPPAASVFDQVVSASRPPTQAAMARTRGGTNRGALAGSHNVAPIAKKPLQPPPQPLHIGSAPREQFAAAPGVEARAADQLGHKGVAGHEIAVGQRAR
jgi:hypothetical protein